MAAKDIRLGADARKRMLHDKPEPKGAPSMPAGGMGGMDY